MINGSQSFSSGDSLVLYQCDKSGRSPVIIKNSQFFLHPTRQPDITNTLHRFNLVKNALIGKTNRLFAFFIILKNLPQFSKKLVPSTKKPLILRNLFWRNIPVISVLNIKVAAFSQFLQFRFIFGKTNNLFCWKINFSRSLLVPSLCYILVLKFLNFWTHKIFFSMQLASKRIELQALIRWFSFHKSNMWEKRNRTIPLLVYRFHLALLQKKSALLCRLIRGTVHGRRKTLNIMVTDKGCGSVPGTAQVIVSHRCFSECLPR